EHCACRLRPGGRIPECRTMEPPRQERSRLAADWPRCGQNRRDGWPRFTFVVRGTSALAQMRNKEQPMNAMPSEKPSETIETTVEDPNLAAVSEVEAGIRDFVRND